MSTESTESPHLQMARVHLHEAQVRIARQQALIARLTEDGHDVKTAKALLETMESMTRVMQEHLDQLEAGGH